MPSHVSRRRFTLSPLGRRSRPRRWGSAGLAVGVFFSVSSMAAAAAQAAPARQASPGVTSSGSSTELGRGGGVPAAVVPAGSFVVALPLAGGNLLRALALSGVHGLDRAARVQALLASAPPAAVAQRVEVFAAANSLPVIAATHWDVTVAVSPAQAASVFHVTLHAVTSPLAPGKAFQAPTAPVAVPPGLRGLVSTVVGFDTRPAMATNFLTFSHGRAQGSARTSAVHAATTAPPPYIPGTYTVAQLGAAYQINTLGTGTGETVAIPEFGGFSSSDVQSFAQGSGLAIGQNQIQVQTVDGGAGTTTSTNGLVEASLDSELVLGLAPSATQIIINAPNSGAGVIDAYTAIAQDETNGTAIQAVTTSWAQSDMSAYGGYTPATLQSTIATVIAGGATLFAASGDSGAYANSSPSAPDNRIAVTAPAEFSDVTGVGGTQLPNGPGQVETGWTTAAPLAPGNSTAWQGNASGGGYSRWVPQPTWQHAVMPNATTRTVPDVSSNAGTGIQIYESAGMSTPGWELLGGTSSAAPTWAAGLVDALSKVGSTTGLGNINPTLYSNPGAFTAMTTGTNFAYNTNANGSYSLVSGMGSPLWSVLGPELAPAPVPTGPPLSGRVAVGVNSNSNPELFATDTHGNLVHTWRCTTCTGGWSGWGVLASGGFVGTPSVHVDSTGRMEVTVRTSSGSLDVFWQNVAAGGPWDGPTVLGTGVTSAPDLIAWPNGRLEVFATGGGQVLHVWQNAPGVGNWSPEMGLGGNPMPGTRVAVGMNSAGYAEVFATSTAGQLVHSWFTGAAPGGWSGWGLLQPQAVMGSPSVGQNADGRLEVFVRASNGSLYHAWQNAPSAGPWYGGNLGGTLASSPVVTQTPAAAGGNLDVFANSSGQVVEQQQQPSTAAYWSGWQSLGGSPSGAVAVGPNGDLMLSAPTPTGPLQSSYAGVAWSRWAPEN